VSASRLAPQVFDEVWRRHGHRIAVREGESEVLPKSFGKEALSKSGLNAPLHKPRLCSPAFTSADPEHQLAQARMRTSFFWADMIEPEVPLAVQRQAQAIPR